MLDILRAFLSVNRRQSKRGIDANDSCWRFSNFIVGLWLRIDRERNQAKIERMEEENRELNEEAEMLRSLNEELQVQTRTLREVVRKRSMRLSGYYPKCTSHSSYSLE